MYCQNTHLRFPEMDQFFFRCLFVINYLSAIIILMTYSISAPKPISSNDYNFPLHNIYNILVSLINKFYLKFQS